MRQAPVIENVILERVIQSELDIPHALSEFRGNLEPNIRENVMGKWDSLKRWFVDTPGRDCESRKVLQITNDVIRSIIQNAALIVQLQNWGISRKDDYQKFLRMFLRCENLEDAHRLAAHVFGVQKIQHFKTNCLREEDRINGSIYEEPPAEFQIKPRSRTYRERKDRQGFSNKSLEKMMQREAYLQSVKSQEKIVMRYVKNKKITFSEIEGPVPEMTKNIFLQWIAMANMNSQKSGQTEFGQEYRLLQKEGTCILKCEDGDLTMPAYILEFK